MSISHIVSYENSRLYTPQKGYVVRSLRGPLRSTYRKLSYDCDKWTSITVAGVQLPSQGVLTGVQSTVNIRVQHRTQRLTVRYSVPWVLGEKYKLLKQSHRVSPVPL